MGSENCRRMRKTRNYSSLISFKLIALFLTAVLSITSCANLRPDNPEKPAVAAEAENGFVIEETYSNSLPSDNGISGGNSSENGIESKSDETEDTVPTASNDISEKNEAGATAEESQLGNVGHAFVDDGVVVTLYSSYSSNRVYPASLTKLCTILYALTIMEPDHMIEPGDEVYMPPEGSSFAYIRPRHVLTLEMLIEGMLLPSGNDAAYAVAAEGGYIIRDDESISSEEAVAAFVDGMNDYARGLGCTDTNFTTPDGFAGNEHYSTTGDMAIIAREAANNEIIMKYAGTYKDDVVYASGHTNTWINTNKFLDPESEFYDEHVTGLKTGSLEGSYSMITVYEKDGKRLIVGVFGSQTKEGRYKDTIALIKEYMKP